MESEAGGALRRKICTHSCLPAPRPRACSTALTTTRTGAWQGHMGNYSGMHPHCEPGCPGFSFVEHAWEMAKMPVAPLLVMDPLARLLPDERAAADSGRFVRVMKGDFIILREIRARFLDSKQENVLPEFEGYVEASKNKDAFVWEWVRYIFCTFCDILPTLSLQLLLALRLEEECRMAFKFVTWTSFLSQLERSHTEHGYISGGAIVHTLAPCTTIDFIILPSLARDLSEYVILLMRSTARLC
jgi:hypothetical protein